MATTHVPSHTNGRITALLTPDEARALTTQINETAGQLCLLLVEAHERRAWEALGYKSWREYATKELRVSQSRAYQILDHGRVTLALAGAVSGEGDFSTNVELTESAARQIKPLLPEVTEEVRVRTAAGEPAATVVPEVVTAAREIATATKPNGNGKKPPPAEHPEYGADDTSVDPVAEWERAEKEVDRLKGVIASMEVDDTAREIAALHAKYAQLNGRLQQALETGRVARSTAEGHQRRLNRIAKALDVREWDQIIPTIEALRGV